MLGVAAAFSGGLFVRQTLEGVRLPQLRRADDTTPAFKLCVRVLSAAVPGLGAPGVFSRQRPFLEVAIGTTQKETELADFVSGDSAGAKAGAGSRECPWRFDDTLTFVVRLQDVQGPGLRLRLRVRSDLTLGPLQFELRAADVGEATVDLRRRVLPACVQERRGADGAVSSWASPMMLVPVNHVRGGLCGADTRLGEAVAHVALLFSLDTDPEAILNACEASGRTLEKKLEDTVAFYASLLTSLSGNAPLPLAVPSKDLANKVIMQAPLDVEAALARAASRAWLAADVAGPLRAPDLSPEGWRSLRGPNGRTYWHNIALGPPPWDDDAHAAARPALNGPEDAPEGWISHRGADGRMFWHNTGLGPAPWEVDSPAYAASRGAAGGAAGVTSPAAAGHTPAPAQPSRFPPTSRRQPRPHQGDLSL